MKKYEILINVRIFYGDFSCHMFFTAHSHDFEYNLEEMFSKAITKITRVQRVQFTKCRSCKNLLGLIYSKLRSGSCNYSVNNIHTKMSAI